MNTPHDLDTEEAREGRQNLTDFVARLRQEEANDFAEVRSSANRENPVTQLIAPHLLADVLQSGLAVIPDSAFYVPITQLLETVPRFPIVRDTWGRLRELRFSIFPNSTGDTRAVYEAVDGARLEPNRSFLWLYENIASDDDLRKALRQAEAWAAANDVEPNGEHVYHCANDDAFAPAGPDADGPYCVLSQPQPIQQPDAHGSH